MKRSTLAFYTSEKEGVSAVYQHPDLQKLVETYSTASHSVIMSLAGYLCWKFPELPVPTGQLTTKKPKFYTKEFPNFHIFLNPNHNQWIQVLCQAVNQDNAVRDGDALFLKYEVSEEYGKLLLDVGFHRTVVEGKTTWSHVRNGLSAPPEQNRKEILFVACSQYLNDRPRIHLDSLYIGMYFNNERWRSMNLFENGQPTNDLYEKASLIIVPGSSLAVYADKKELKDLITKLREVFSTNKTVKILGVCFGCQLLAEIFDGKASKAAIGTFGTNEIELFQEEILKLNLPFLAPLENQKVLTVSQFHGDEIATLPTGFTVVSSSPNCRCEIVASHDSRVLGIQCHPEYSTEFVRAYSLILKNYSKGVTEEEIAEAESQKLTTTDTGGNVLRSVIRKFIESCSVAKPSQKV